MLGPDVFSKSSPNYQELVKNSIHCIKIQCTNQTASICGLVLTEHLSLSLANHYLRKKTIDVSKTKVCKMNFDRNIAQSDKRKCHVFVNRINFITSNLHDTYGI